jgi:methyltransferase
MNWYVLLIGVVAVERLAEVVVSKRNRVWSQARGGVEFGAGHYPAMVALHTGLLAGHWTTNGTPA